MLRRRSHLPDQVRQALDLPPGDRVLAAAHLADGTWGVASFRCLRVVSDAGARVAGGNWWDVDRAGFDPETSTMRVQWVDNRPDLELPFGKGNPSAFALTVRERVQRSVILADSVPLGGGKTARVAVRRDGDGVMFSQVVGDPGVDLGNPRIAALVDDAEARVRLASGLPE